MKIIKKIANISVPLLLLALLAFRLASNKAATDEQLQKMTQYNEIVPVKTITASRQKTSLSITENGLFRAARQVAVISETQGNVIQSYADIGDFVKAGQVLVTVEKGLLTGQYELAKINLENARADLKRYKNLVAGDAVTQQQYEGVKLRFQNALTSFQQLEKQLSNTQITAPVSGFISARNIEKGSFIVPGASLFTISQQSELQFVVQMSEYDILKINKGDSACIKSSVSENLKFGGVVNEIAVNNSLSGRYNVFITLTSPPASIKPGMSGTAVFELQSEKNEIIIPRKCLVGSITDPYIFVVQGDSVTKKSVSAASLDEYKVLIHSGINEGDKIVIAGQINLEQGSKVEVKN